jgi:hypothetical protein
MGFIFREWNGGFSPVIVSRLALGPSQLSIEWMLRVHYPRIMWPECEADNSSWSIAELNVVCNLSRSSLMLEDRNVSFLINFCTYNRDLICSSWFQSIALLSVHSCILFMSVIIFLKYVCILNL